MAFEEDIEVLLDEALEATFPASDPIALAIAVERRKRDAEASSEGEG